jgi:hypothetical protein
MAKLHGFFKVACQDAARIVSILSLDSADVTRPRNLNSFWINAYEKCVFFGRFFYMVFVKGNLQVTLLFAIIITYLGFTPTIFDLLPYWLWQTLTISIYIYRLTIVPLWLRITGYGSCASWTNPPIGSNQPSKHTLQAKPLSEVSLTTEKRLAQTDFGDPEYEKLLATIHSKGLHLSPHSQSPSHPFVAGFPGNFMNHLTGVYKILIGKFTNT